MKKGVKIVLAITGVIFLGVVIRFGIIAFDSMGTGRSQDSPDKRFQTRVSSLWCKKFWGGNGNRYEFTVQSLADGRVLQHVLMEEPPQGMVSWRDDDMIQWAADSSSVT